MMLMLVEWELASRFAVDAASQAFSKSAIV